MEIAPKSGSATGAFQSFLTDAIGKVQQTQDAANATADRFLSGENEEVHQVAIETQTAELQFEMFMAVRNKVVQAYQEVMKMQM
jgi:flagellar hook-basal body complex protein FliE